MAQRRIFQQRPTPTDEQSVLSNSPLNPSMDSNQVTSQNSNIDSPQSAESTYNYLKKQPEYLYENQRLFNRNNPRCEDMTKDSPNHNANTPRNEPKSSDRQAHITPPVVSSQQFIYKRPKLSKQVQPFYSEGLDINQNASDPHRNECVRVGDREETKKKDREDGKSGQCKEVMDQAGPSQPRFSSDSLPPWVYTRKPMVDSNQPLSLPDWRHRGQPGQVPLGSFQRSSTASKVPEAAQLAVPLRPKSPPSASPNNVNVFRVVSPSDIADTAIDLTEKLVDQVDAGRKIFPQPSIIPKYSSLPSTLQACDGTNTAMPLPLSGERNQPRDPQQISYYPPPNIESLSKQNKLQEIEMQDTRREEQRYHERLRSSKAFNPLDTFFPHPDPPLSPSEQVKQRERYLRETEAKGEKEINQSLSLFSGSGAKIPGIDPKRQHEKIDIQPLHPSQSVLNLAQCKQARDFAASRTNPRKIPDYPQGVASSFKLQSPTAGEMFPIQEDTKQVQREPIGSTITGQKPQQCSVPEPKDFTANVLGQIWRPMDVDFSTGTENSAKNFIGGSVVSDMMNALAKEPAPTSAMAGKTFPPKFEQYLAGLESKINGTASGITGGPAVSNLINSLSKESVPPQTMAGKTVPANFDQYLAEHESRKPTISFITGDPGVSDITNTLAKEPAPPSIELERTTLSYLDQLTGVVVNGYEARIDDLVSGVRDRIRREVNPAPEQHVNSTTQAAAEPEAMKLDGEFSDVMLVDQGNNYSGEKSEEEDDWLVV